MIQLKKNGPVICLIIIGEYRDREWAEQFPAIQRKLRDLKKERSSRSTIETFAIDLSACTWADPIPLLTTTISGIEFVREGLSVDIYLPDLCEATTAGNRTLKFLAQEGFIAQFHRWKFNVLDKKGNPIDESDSRRILEIGASLAYQNAEFIPAQVIDLGENRMSPIEQVCGQLIDTNKVDTALKERVPAWARERVRYKLYQILSETLSNIAEHAYEGTTQKLAGVYVRYRDGSLSSSQDRKASEKLLANEHRSCPRLDREFLDCCYGALEVFVVDAGDGLVTNLRKHIDDLNDQDKTGKYPFQWTTQYVFGRQIAKRKRAKPTEYGGLYLLYQLLRADHDYVRGFDDRTWIGDFVPTPGSSQHELVDVPYNGLIWHFRLGWKAKTDVGSRWKTIDQSNRAEVINALSDENILREKTKDWWCLDQRLQDYPYERGVFYESPDCESASLPKNIIWFPPPSLTKFDIINRLEGQVLVSGSICSTGPNELGRTLFVVDIPVHEAETYMAALDNSEFISAKYRWTSKVQVIVLLSRHLAFSILRAESGQTNAGAPLVRFVRDPNHYSQPKPNILIGSTKNIGPFTPQNSFPDLLRWIKWHDSERFWVSLSEQGDDLSYIPDPVSWGIDSTGKVVTLSGYLDFSQALANPLCRAILRMSATRLPGLFGGASAELMPLDSLAKSLADDLCWSDPNLGSQLRTQDSPQRSISIALGSVIVTGATERAIGMQQHELLIHYFKHPDATTERKPHLVHWPRKDNQWFKSLFGPSGLIDLKRIGSTAAIAEKGWKYFELPRYDEHSLSVGVRTPKETYGDWQQSNPVIYKTGHWNYESQHDLQTVNIALALSEAFRRDSDLGCFLVFNFLRLLGIRKEFLNLEGKTWWDRIFEPQTGWFDRKKPTLAPRQHDFDEVALVIYPSHHNTESIVERWISLLLPENGSAIRKRLLPIRGVRGGHGASATLMVPLTLERIRRALAMREIRTVAYLDDAIITGRTLRETMGLVGEQGGQLDQAVAILDRRRMPAGSNNEHPTVRYFWRLDVPTMGSDSSCPLCNAIQLARTLKSALASQSARSRVSEWIEDWKPISPVEDWNRGLPPTRLSDAVEKRFSLRKGMSLGKPIQLIRSTGVATWISELHAMTCEDALASSVAQHGLNKHKWGQKTLPPEALIEALTSQALLFGGDYSTEERQKMLLTIFKCALQLKGNSNHTSLAALSLIANAGEDMHGAKVWWQENLTSASISRLGVADDIQIALAFLIHVGILTNENRSFRDAERLLSSRAAKVADKYRQLYNEVFDFDGNQHSVPLARVSQWGPDFSPHWLRYGLNSIEKLSDLVAELDWTLCDPTSKQDHRNSEIRTKLREALSDAYHHFDDALKSIDPSVKSLPRNEDLVAVTEMVLSLGQQCHSLFFFDIQADQLSQRSFEEKAIVEVLLSRDQPQICRGSSFSFSRNLNTTQIEPRRKKLVCWDLEVKDAVGDLAMNCIQYGSPIPDPWELNLLTTSTLWIQVEYQNEGLIIKLANQSNSDDAEVRRELRKKARLRWQEIFLLGGWVKGPYVHNKRSDVLVIDVYLPYADYLEPEKHLKDLLEY